MAGAELNLANPACSSDLPSTVSGASSADRDSADQLHNQEISNLISPRPSLSWAAGSVTNHSNHRSILDELPNTEFSLTGFLETLGGDSLPNPANTSGFEGLFPVSAGFSDIAYPLESGEKTNGEPDSALNIGANDHSTAFDMGNSFSGSPVPNATLVSQGLLLDSFKPRMQGNAGLSKSLSTQGSCSCLLSALALLETIAIESARHSAPNVGRILQFKKQALAQCNKLLDCERCCSFSSFIMLLVVFCEKLITSYEQVLVVLTEQYKLRQTLLLQDPVGGSPESSGVRPEEFVMSVQDYNLDAEEQPCVFGSLAYMQMKKMNRFLARMKAILRQWKCHLHVVMVDSVEERLRQQLRLFEKDSKAT